MIIAILYVLSYLMGTVLITNSTAQGGGGSFKNRKPITIGELGCCESGMAERRH